MCPLIENKATVLMELLLSLFVMCAVLIDGVPVGQVSHMLSLMVAFPKEGLLFHDKGASGLQLPGRKWVLLLTFML